MPEARSAVRIPSTGNEGNESRCSPRVPVLTSRWNDQVPVSHVEIPADEEEVVEHEEHREDDGDDLLDAFL